MRLTRFPSICNFNPRSREGSDSCCSISARGSRQFQSTLPRRERPCVLLSTCPTHNFNPRSREGSDRPSPVFSIPPADFNPRSREGSDRAPGCLPAGTSISIHAPAKGATNGLEYGIVNGTDFNPRSREGSDLSHYFIYMVFLYFNPRSREGSDPSFAFWSRMVWLFQSTLPRRERRRLPKNIPCDLPISIHAPAKGATLCSGGCGDLDGISIHAPAKGATIIHLLIQPPLPISIHAPAKGATESIICLMVLSRDFNPRSREGSDEPASKV